MDPSPPVSNRELYRWAFRFMRPHWRVALGGTCLMLLTVCAGLLAPWPGQLIVDSVCGDRPFPAWLQRIAGPIVGEGRGARLTFLCAAMLVLAGGQGLLSAWSNTVLIRAGLVMLNDLRCRCYEHLQRLSLVFHDRQSVGDSIYRVTGDTFSIQTLFNAAAVPFVHSTVMLAGMCVILFRMDWAMTLLALCIVPLLFVCLRLFNKRIDRISQQYHETESSIYSVAHESLSAIRTVQAFAREAFEQQRFGEGAARSFEINLRLSRLQLFSSFLIGFIVTAGTVAMWWVCARRVMDGRITVGHIWVVIAYIGMLYGPISSISFLTTTVRGAMARFRRVVEILQTTPQVADRPDAVPFEGGRGEVRFESVSFGYEPGQLVLENVSFEAKPGQLVALVGPSGVGKTTMLSLLLRFYDPLSGRVLVDERDVREFQYQTLRRNIAIVPQEPVLFSTSIRENIAYGQPNATLEQVQEAAHQAEAHEFICAMPQSYNTPAGERGARLSGGQRQRLALARAFLKNAPILILDEPTTALDAETEASVLRSLARLREDRTVIVVAHRLSTVRSASEILVLAEGRIAERGTHETLLNQGALYRRLHELQFANNP